MSTGTFRLVEDGLTQSYFEYRKFHYLRIHEVLQEQGVLEKLKQPVTVDGIIQSFGFKKERKATLKAMLDAMIKMQILCKKSDDLYCADQEKAAASVDNATIRKASGDGAIREHSVIANLAFQFLKGSVDDIQFSVEFQAFWKALLEAPFYAQGRERSLREIALEGGTVLDMASGQGHALIELSKIVGPKGKVYGIEYSKDHIEISKKTSRDAGCGNINVQQGDLNKALPYGSGQFDGVLFIGALHFISERESLVNELARIAKIKSKIAIGNVYSELDTYDRPFMDLIFSMIEPRAYPVNVDDLNRCFGKAGLSVYHKENVGCNAWYLLKRDR